MIRLCVMLCLLAAPALAEDKPPLDISAAGTLEWDRANQIFTAKDQARAQQGEVSIDADLLTAAYAETEESDFDIQSLQADGGVEITSGGNKAYGDMALYDLPTGVAIMRGSDLRLITPEQTITAQDQFEYHTIDGRLVAQGRAQIIRPNDRIEADTLTAFLMDDPKTGKRVLERMEATGNVRITTAEEVLTGQKGVYNAQTGLAEMRGGVSITRGSNVLQGDRAHVDLNTQISRIFAAPAAGGLTPGSAGQQGRVSGTFYPGSVKNTQ